MTSYAQRMHVGLSHEDTVSEMLWARGWTVHPFGQALLTAATREALRSLDDCLLRWLPDRLAVRGPDVLPFDGKAGRTDTKSYCIEKTSHAAGIWLASGGVPVVYVWPDFQVSYLGDLADDLLVSGRQLPWRTPYWLLPKFVGRDFDSIFGAHLPR